MQTFPERGTASDTAVLAGGGVMGALMRQLDWSSTPVGAVDDWPQSLRTAVGMLLDSQFPTYIAWGPEFIQFYNDAYRPILGATKHPAALGQSTVECFAEIWDFIGPMFRRVMAGGDATFLEDQLLPLDRFGYVEECYFTFSYSAIRDEGAVGGVLVTCVETTPRLLGERRLRTLRELAARAVRSQTALDACSQAIEPLRDNPHDVPFAMIYAVDAGKRIATLACCTGVERGGPLAPESIRLDAAPPIWPLEMVAGSGELRRIELPVAGVTAGPWPEPIREAVALPVGSLGDQGSMSVLVAGLSPRRAFDEEYRGFFSTAGGQIATNIANARAYDDERRRAEHLAEIDRAKTAFFSNVSHEFRTPLTLMLAPLEDMLNDDERPLAEPQRERAVVVQRNAVRLLKLVNTLLDFSRIEAGRAIARFAPVDLAGYTAELASTFRSAVQRAGLRFVVDCPALGEPVYVDREMWEKVILNLLSNAFKYTFDGEIVVRVRREGDDAVVTVRDTGVGIPEAEIPRVFERFHRIGGSRARSHEGSGIGLSLVQELVRLHGGSIQVESREGRGSAFTIRLPFGTARLPAESVTTVAEPTGGSARAGAYVDEAERWLENGVPLGDERVRAATGDVSGDVAGHVVLADDNADMRDYVARLLRDRGWRVDAVADGAAALETIFRDPPEIVLCDVMMPRMDGFELLAALRRRPELHALPVILLSARAGQESRIEGLAAGADDYVIKPFSAQELVARLESHLKLARTRIAAERALADQASLVETLQRVGTALTSELDLSAVVQRVTEETTALCGAEFGAFFYNVTDEKGESYTLYTIAGVPREAFSKFPMPRNTAVFEPTFRGTSTLRSDDITKDPRYGHTAPHYGMPKGHLPVRSYLAVPVISRAGAVLGGLFFGHSKAGMFTERDERVVSGVAGWAAVAIDNANLYERERKARGDAEAAREDAEQANRAKTDFLAMMSHELRTPLNAISGYTELLAMELRGPLTPAQRADLDRISRSQKHLLGLINDVLNFARIEAGHVEVRLGPVLLAPLFGELEELVAPQVAAKQLEYVADASDGGLAVQADAEKLRQVLLNLLGNAVKFTEPGGRVTLRARPEGAKVRIEVSDTGRGIPPGQLDSVFDPFVQVDRRLTSERHDGVGLGLAISRDLTRAMGGEITVSSTVGAGSAFSVTLPTAT